MLVTKPQPVPAQNQPRYQFLVLHSSQKSDKQGLSLTWLNVDVKDRIICLTKSFVIDNVDNLVSPPSILNSWKINQTPILPLSWLYRTSSYSIPIPGYSTQPGCMLSAIKVLYLLQWWSESYQGLHHVVFTTNLSHFTQ